MNVQKGLLIFMMSIALWGILFYFAAESQSKENKTKTVEVAR